MLKNNISYTTRAGSSLIFLWIGAISLLAVMLYNWRSETNPSDVKGAFLKPDGIFIDQLLLSSQDLQLGESVGLINISLNRDAATKPMMEEDNEVANTSPERKLVYSKMLKNKIKKIASAPVNNNGFTIKPLPQ